MATLYISYFGAVRDHIAGTPIGSETVTTSTTTAASGAVPQAAKAIAVVSDTAHYVTIGSGTPTATATNGFYLPANQIREISVGFNTSTTVKLAAITLA